MAITFDGTNITFSDASTQSAGPANPTYTQQTPTLTGVLTTGTTSWVKPAGAIAVRIESVGGGGSGQNPGTQGLPGTYYDSGYLTFPSASETFTVSIGAAGVDPMSQWGGSGAGGNTTVTTSKGTYTAPGGAASGGAPALPFGTPGGAYSSFPYGSPSGVYGRAGSGASNENAPGSYGAQAGAIHITYYS
jgi:hypothetical protein